jgi:hypothetical protein
MDKIEEVDLWKTKAFEKDLEAARLAAEGKMMAFEAHLTALWAKYQLRRGIDEIRPDGSIVRAEKAE